MTAYLQWNCDFCKKPSITMSQSGILYCNNCRMSYGENLKQWYDYSRTKELRSGEKDT